LSDAEQERLATALRKDAAIALDFLGLDATGQPQMVQKEPDFDAFAKALCQIGPLACLREDVTSGYLRRCGYTAERLEGSSTRGFKLNPAEFLRHMVPGVSPDRYWPGDAVAAAFPGRISQPGAPIVALP